MDCTEAVPPTLIEIEERPPCRPRPRSLLLRRALELRRELLDAAGGVDQALLAGEGGMGVHGDVAQDHVVFLTVDRLLAARLHGRLGEETLAGGNVDKA